MNFKKQFITFIKKYSYACVLLYFFIYMIWFNYLERTVTTDSKYNLIYSKIDDLIPFCEYFVIPYTLWFAYIAVAVVFFLFASKKDFLRLTAFLFIGMTICLIIYTLYPNGQALRPTEFARDNMFVDLVKSYYKTDTPTNVCPSIHCLNSIGVSIAILSSEKLRGKKFIKIFTTLFTISIMMSTVFIKQHSVVDMLGAIILSTILYSLIYLPDYQKINVSIKAFAAKKKSSFALKD